MHRVLVLGGGFIGAATTAALLAEGHTVTVVTRTAPDPERQVTLTGAAVVIGDAARMDILVGLLPEVDAVVYALGSSTPVESERDPAGDVSEVLPPVVRLLELIRLQSRTRLIFLSSGGTVYGNAEHLPIKENAPTRPVSSYGILKLACENYIEMYSQVHGVRACVLRISNPYGPGQSWDHGQGLVARLFHCARSGEPITLFGGGETVRDYLFIEDLARTIAAAVSCEDAPAVVNVGSGVGHRGSQVADLVREITGRRFPVRLELPRGYDVERNVLDVTLARETFGLKVRSLRDGLRDTWKAQQVATLASDERSRRNAAHG